VQQRQAEEEWVAMTMLMAMAMAVVTFISSPPTHTSYTLTYCSDNRNHKPAIRHRMAEFQRSQEEPQRMEMEPVRWNLTVL